MASLNEYIERRTDAELQGTLYSFCMGTVDITVESAFLICCELARRNPELPDPSRLFRDLCKKYF